MIPVSKPKRKHHNILTNNILTGIPRTKDGNVLNRTTLAIAPAAAPKPTNQYVAFIKVPC